MRIQTLPGTLVLTLIAYGVAGCAATKERSYRSTPNEDFVAGYDMNPAVDARNDKDLKTAYAVAQQIKVKDASSYDGEAGGIGLRMRNPQYGLRTELYGGSGDTLDSWFGGLLEGTMYIPAWQAGSRKIDGGGLLFEPYLTGGLRGDSLETDVQSIRLGTLYGDVGASMDWWLSKQSRIYLDVRGGMGLNFGSVNSDPPLTFPGGEVLEQDIQVSPMPNGRFEVGADIGGFNIAAFYDFRGMKIENSLGGDTNADVSIVGLHLGYTW